MSPLASIHLEAAHAVHHATPGSWASWAWLAGTPDTGLNVAAHADDCKVLIAGQQAGLLAGSPADEDSSPRSWCAKGPAAPPYTEARLDTQGARRSRRRGRNFSGAIVRHSAGSAVTTCAGAI